MKNCPLCGIDADDNAASCECGYQFASAREDHATSAEETSISSEDGERWKMAGGVITTVSAGGLMLGLFMDTSVETRLPSQFLDEAMPSAIVNLDLMFTKGVAIASSLTGIGIGIFCLAVGAILSAIARR